MAEGDARAADEAAEPFEGDGVDGDSGAAGGADEAADEEDDGAADDEDDGAADEADEPFEDDEADSAAAGPDPIRDRLRDMARRMPMAPGVYLFKDAAGEVLYVGKSKRLRARVSSYLRSRSRLEDRIATMVDRAVDLDCLVVETEEEALILEYQLIHRHEPPFNVIFRDDKSYPWIMVTREAYPRITFTREPARAKGRGERHLLLGPYADAASVRRTIKLVTRLFKIRVCKADSESLGKLRPCLYFHIKRCTGPCRGTVSEADYGRQVEEAVDFLKGDMAKVRKELEARMQAAATELAFEDAAGYRDQMRALDRISARMRMVTKSNAEIDVWAVASDGERCCVETLVVRGGRVLGHLRVFRDLSEIGGEDEFLTEVLKSRYLGGGTVPRLVLVDRELAEAVVLEGSFGRVAERRVELRASQRGEGRGLLDMARHNAELALRGVGGQGTLPSKGRRREDLPGMEALQSLLDLPGLPRRIEAFDISNFGPRNMVAAMVVAVDGCMARRAYRRYRIKTVPGPDDPACMAEVIFRRYRRVMDDELPRPDLVVVDGGRTQVAAARAAMAQLGIDLPLIGLAKREERIVRLEDPEGFPLERGHPARLLLERIRNEVHRFAVTYHRNMRSKDGLGSRLDGIRGLGPTLRMRLLRRFGSVSRLAEAGVDELASVQGVSRKLALRLHGALDRSPDASPKPASEGTDDEA